MSRLSLDAEVSKGVLTKVEASADGLPPEMFLKMARDVQDSITECWGITGWAPTLVEVISAVSHAS